MKVKFKGFNGEDLIVRVVLGYGGEHHHLEVWHNGKRLWYAHLTKDAISLWQGKFHVGRSKAENNIYIELGDKQ